MAAEKKTFHGQKTSDVMPLVAAQMGAASTACKLLQGCCDGGEDVPTACASHRAHA